MIFSEGIKEFLSRISKSANDSLLVDKAKSKLNSAYKEVGKAYLWRHLERVGEVRIKGTYRTGSVAISKDSRVISGSGTAWTSEMVGWYFQSEKSGNLYEVLSVDSPTQITLRTKIVDDDGSALSYQLWKKFYRINPDTRIILPDESRSDLAVPFSVHGTDRRVSDYTGSMSVTKDSDILTGAGTLFIDNVYEGDEIKLGSFRYRVKRVDSDTQITMLNYAVETLIEIGTIKSINPLNAVLPNVPTTDGILQYSYIKYVYDLINDNDRTELPDDFDEAIFGFAKGEYSRDTNSGTWQNEILLAQGRLDTLKKNSVLVKAPYQQFAPLIRKGNGR